MTTNASRDRVESDISVGDRITRDGAKFFRVVEMGVEARKGFGVSDGVRVVPVDDEDADPTFWTYGQIDHYFTSVE